ncbi:WD repeat-containing protein 63 [Biomphalaria pfeifferi]|uniref:WD repeat-containing protein 63 n=1 Tax=Biomphalaria pfeifferi TaxID=112525 RepID=A0AAD8FLK5_BIOPF|nr:WD repeat-containing protein 63 [Biomphalaria pfeifferi]
MAESENTETQKTDLVGEDKNVNGNMEKGLTQVEDKEEDSSQREKNVSANADSPPETDKKEKKVVKTKVKGKPSKDDIQVEQTQPVAESTEANALPENVFPLFMTSKTQEIYNCKCDEDVTIENPFIMIPKADILEDMRMRAAVCDFHPFKQEILDYPGEDILIMYDYEFKYGQNFVVALTEEAKELLLKSTEEDKTEADGQAAEEEDDTVYLYVPPESKEWVSQGSEKEIDEGILKEGRRKLKVSVKRIRKEFGAAVTFEDRNVSDAKDGSVDCPSSEDRSFAVARIELDKGTQAIHEMTSEGVQTNWTYPRTATVQTYPREFTEQEKLELYDSASCKQFVFSAEYNFHLALQQNEITSVFYIDWHHLGDSDDTFGSKADNHMKEYQSFTDLQFSKDKVITCIQWHPVTKGVVATAVAEKLSFDERIDQSARVIMTPSIILIWSFTDPIHPQLILEAPDDIYSFAFNNTNPNYIAGGCYNGQIILWDITSHADRLKQQRGSNRNKKRTVLPGFEDPNALKTPIIHYCAVSSIDHSHRAPVTDIQWLPDHMQITKMGVPQENITNVSTQLISCATDNVVLFWDTKPSKVHQIQDDKTKMPMGIPATFKYLDLTWKPLLRVTLAKSEPGGDHAPIKFSIQEKQKERLTVTGAKSEMKDIDLNKTASTSQKPTSGKEKTLHGVKTFMYVGTEDGEVVYVDWMPQKDQDSGKIQTPKPAFYHCLHDGPIVSMERSPFFKEVLLSVGGWTFALWKEGVSSGPILCPAASNVRLSCGMWSPTRPGVFFISKVDGTIDVWDLLDKTHEPTLTQSVSPTSISAIYPYQVTQKQQLIAVGDYTGTLHILEIPWSLRHPTANEVNAVSNYIEREVKRRAFVEERWNFREREKREQEAEVKRKIGIVGAMAPLTEEEIEMKQRLEYDQYLAEESAFLRQLGIIQDDEVLV